MDSYSVEEVGPGKRHSPEADTRPENGSQRTVLYVEDLPPGLIDRTFVGPMSPPPDIEFRHRNPPPSPSEYPASLQDDESEIRRMTRLALTHGAINLGQGTPDWDPPPEARRAAMRAVAREGNQYSVTWGIKELRDEITRVYQARFAPHFDWVDPERHVTVTLGVTEGICSAVRACIRPGDHVVVIEPTHENYGPAVRFAGGTPIFTPLEPPYFTLDPERLSRSVTDRTKAVILNTPHNPTGRVFTKDELSAVAALCIERNLVLITDEIYDRILYDGRPHVPPATLPGMRDRTITVSGLGKTFAMTGWRLGHVVAPDHLSKGVRIAHDFGTVCAPTPLQQGAAAALRVPESFYEKLSADFHQRRDTMMRILRTTGFDAYAPEGAYYVLAGFDRWNFEGSGREFAEWLTRKAGVTVVPGSSFYDTPGIADRYVRFAFGKKIETLEAAGDRLAEAFRMR